MNNDYYMKDGSSGESCCETGGEVGGENKLSWYQRMRNWVSKSIFTNSMFFTFIILFIFIAIVIYWNHFRPK